MLRRSLTNVFAFAHVGLAVFTLFSLNLIAADTACPKCGCENGMRVVEVSRTVCKMVPKEEPIKKTVYEKKEVPYCEHCLPKIGDLLHHQQICPSCAACGKTKTVLVKKSIECGKKTVYECVAEEVKEQVCMPCNQCGFCKHHPQLHKLSDASQDAKPVVDSPALPSPPAVTSTAPASSRRTTKGLPVSQTKSIEAEKVAPIR